MQNFGRGLIAVGTVVAASNFAVGPAFAGSVAGERPATTPACPACGHNLILNSGAEAGPGTNNDGVVKVPDWKQTGGFTAAPYAWGGGDISATTPGPKSRGKNYFYGGPDAARSTGTQLITVPAGAVSSGKVTYVVSGWLGGYSDQGDDATLYVTFENAGGATISANSIGPVTPVQRKNDSELLFRHRTGPVPAATAMVKVRLVMVRYDGSDNDGMADNLSLVFSLPA